MVKNVYEVSFSSEVYEVKRVVTDVLAFTAEVLPHLTREDYCDLRLVFSELLFNAVIHGNHEDMTKSVHLFVEINDDMVYSVVSDEGFGFDYLNLLANLDDVSGITNENGRGIRLVYSLTDSIAFNVSGSEIKFHKRVTHNG